MMIHIGVNNEIDRSKLFQDGSDLIFFVSIKRVKPTPQTNYSLFSQLFQVAMFWNGAPKLDT